MKVRRIALLGLLAVAFPFAALALIIPSGVDRSVEWSFDDLVADVLFLTPTDTEPTGAEGTIYWDDSENTIKIHNGTSFGAIGTGTFTGGSITSDISMTNGEYIRSSTTTGESTALQVYDNDTGPAYVNALSWTNGNTPAIALGAAGNTLSILSNAFNVSTAGALSGITTLAASGVATVGGLTATGTSTIGGGTGTLAIDTSSWDITSAGAASGLTTLSLTDDISVANGKGLKSSTTTGQTAGLYGYDNDAAAYVGALVVTNGNTPAVVLGSANGTSAITSSDWAISTTGAMTGIGAITADGLVTAGAGVTVATGQAVTVGVVPWTAAGDKIDGEAIADDTIDDDSIDWSDVTAADITFAEGDITDSTIVSADIKDGVLAEADLKAVDEAADEDFLTYESTTGDFEWHSIADVSAGIAGDIAEGELADSIVVSADIKDATIASADLAADVIQVATVELSNADIKALVSAPKQLVAAPAAGSMIQLISAVLVLDYGSEVLTESDDNLVIQYQTSGQDATAAIETTGFIDAAADTVAIVAPSAIATVASANLAANALTLFNTGDGEYAGNASNDTTMTVKVTYRVIDLGL